jgi:hypothetical protein
VEQQPPLPVILDAPLADPPSRPVQYPQPPARLGDPPPRTIKCTLVLPPNDRTASVQLPAGATARDAILAGQRFAPEVNLADWYIALDPGEEPFELDDSLEEVDEPRYLWLVRRPGCANEGGRGTPNSHEISIHLPNGGIDVKCFDESVTAKSVLDNVLAGHPEFAGDLRLEVDGARLTGDDLVRPDGVCVIQEGYRTCKFQFDGSHGDIVRRVSVLTSVRAVIKEIRDDDPHEMILCVDGPLPMDEIFVDVVPRDKVTMIRRLPLSYEISNGDQRFTIELNDDATVDTLKVAIESIIHVALDRISLCVGDEEITGNGILIDRYSKLQRILLNVLDPNYESVEESGKSHFFLFSEDVTIQFIFEFLTEKFHYHVGLSDSGGICPFQIDFPLGRIQKRIGRSQVRGIKRMGCGHQV